MAIKLINIVLLGALAMSSLVMPSATMALSIATASIIALNTILLIRQYYKNKNIKQGIIKLKDNTTRDNFKPECFYSTRDNTQIDDSESTVLNKQPYNYKFVPFIRLNTLMSMLPKDKNWVLSTIRTALEELKLTMHHSIQNNLMIDIDGSYYASEHVTLEWTRVHQEYRNILLRYSNQKPVASGTTLPLYCLLWPVRASLYVYIIK